MKKVLLLMVGAALLLSLLAMGCGSSGDDPATTIDNAYKKSLDYKTVHEEYEMKIAIDGDASAIDESLAFLLPLDMTITGSADIDNSDKDDPKMQMSVSLEGLGDIIENAAAAGGSEEMEAVMGGGMFDTLFSNMEVRLVDRTLYLMMMGSWYEMDTQEMASQATGAPEDLDTSCAQDAMEEKLVPSAVLTDIEEIGDEDIDGESTRHFKAKVDIGKATDVMAEVARDCDQADAAGALEGGSSDLTEMFKTLDVEIWVDGDDNMRKLIVNMELDTAAFSGFEDTNMDADQAAALETMSISMTMTTTQSRFDEDVDIKAPEGALPFEDLFGNFMGMDSGFDDMDSGFDDIGTTTDDVDTGTGTGGDTGTIPETPTTTNPFST